MLFCTLEAQGAYVHTKVSNTLAHTSEGALYEGKLTINFQIWDLNTKD